MEKLVKEIKAHKRPFTKKEKVLFCLLMLVILLWASNRFVFQVQAEKLAELEGAEADYELQLMEMNEILKGEEKIKEDWRQLNRDRERILNKYFPSLDQSQIIYLLNHLIKDENIWVEDLNFNRPSSEILGDLEVPMMEVDMPFEGQYDQVLNLISAIKASPRKILIDNLSLDRWDGENIAGSMSLQIYSLEGIADLDPIVIPVEGVENDEDVIPFAPYDDYAGDPAYGDGYDGESPIGDDYSYGKDYSYGEDFEERPDLKEGMRKEVLHEFDTINYSFIPSHPHIKGRVYPSSLKKSGSCSLRFEYHIIALEEDNRAYVDLSKANISLGYPPETIGVWVHSYGYSPGILGIRFMTQSREFIDVTLSEGISWLGWKYLELSPPEDLSLYPLRVDKVYLQLPYDRDDYGVLVLDKMEAFYRQDPSQGYGDSDGAYIFYLVKVGDTLEGIAKEIYGSREYIREIMELNDIRDANSLPVGKVLVLRRP